MLVNSLSNMAYSLHYKRGLCTRPATTTKSLSSVYVSVSLCSHVCLWFYMIREHGGLGVDSSCYCVWFDSVFLGLECFQLGMVETQETGETPEETRHQWANGHSYRLLYGDTKDDVNLLKEATSKPMNLSNDIVPRVLPLIHQTIKSYGKFSVIWFGPKPRVNIMDPELIRDILSNKFGHFQKPKSNPLFKFILTGIIGYEGDKWAKHRRIINPAFHLEKLKRMLPAFYTCCSEMVSRWEKYLMIKESYELDVLPELQNLTRDVIFRAAFGSSYGEGRQIFQLRTEQTSHIIQAAESVYIPGSRFLPTERNKRMKQIDKEVRALLMGIINKREKAIEMGETNNDDLLGELMESNSKEIQKQGNNKNFGISIDEMIEECKLFYFAGQETTSILLVWTMIMLSIHQNWQVRSREEVLQVFGNNKPDFDGLARLKIITMILYEVLRLYPSVSMLNRSTYKEMKLGEITLPSGIEVSLPMLLVHHDRDLWGDDAQEFKPERFSEGVSSATKNQVCFFPFGWGPRICIGQNFALLEAKMAVALILQRFSFELSSFYSHAPGAIGTIQPQFGAPLILRKM